MACRGFVRGLGLSVNQAVHLPGAGDFVMQEIRAPARPDPIVAPAASRKRSSSQMQVDGGDPTGLATADPALRDSLERENVPDPLDAEQTWPTEEVCYAESAISNSVSACTP